MKLRASTVYELLKSVKEDVAEDFRKKVKISDYMITEIKCLDVWYDAVNDVYDVKLEVEIYTHACGVKLRYGWVKYNVIVGKNYMNATVEDYLCYPAYAPFLKRLFEIAFTNFVSYLNKCKKNNDLGIEVI